MAGTQGDTMAVVGSQAAITVVVDTMAMVGTQADTTVIEDTMAAEGDPEGTMVVAGTRADTTVVVDTMAMEGTQGIITLVTVRGIIQGGTAGGGMDIILAVIGGVLGVMLILVWGGLIRMPIHIPITILILILIHIIIPIHIVIPMICHHRASFS